MGCEMEEIPNHKQNKHITIAIYELKENLRGEVICDLSNNRCGCIHRICTEEDPCEADEVEGNDLPQEPLYP